MAIEGRGDAGRGRKIRLGMVGGGEGAFIGAVHRIASRIDDQYELVAGALSSTAEKSRRSGVPIARRRRRASWRRPFSTDGAMLRNAFQRRSQEHLSAITLRIRGARTARPVGSRQETKSSASF